MYKVVDLFAGAGGLSLGFEQTNKFEVVVAVEMHPAAQLTYKENHSPDVTVLDDILEITDFMGFIEEHGQVDVVIGGPPCQGFSNANRKRFDLIDQNNNLVKKYIEFIEKLKPKAFVMENVPMFKSKTHRFYISSADDEEDLSEGIFKEKILLFQGDFLLGIDVLKRFGGKHDVRQYLIEERLLRDLIIIQKKMKDEKKIKSLIAKQGSKFVDTIEKSISSQKSDSEVYDKFFKNSLLVFSRVIAGEVPSEDVTNKVENFIKVQRYFYIIQELKDNDIKYDEFELNEDKLEVEVKAITVFTYLMKKLDKLYKMDEGVLNAVWFGAPQMRKRFIAMGIRRDLIPEDEIKVKLPTPNFTEDQYRTVSDAISDLEIESPQYDVGLKFIPLANIEIDDNSLLYILRDVDKLQNHVITQTREHILKRFEQLEQGQNFHDLDMSLIDTYTDPTRTQNSIYKRLNYSAASPTVTNVRKSMWIHPTRNRAVSIREAARLQTFPDSFIFRGTKDAQYQQVGNAVPPILSNAIANQLLSILEEAKV